MAGVFCLVSCAVLGQDEETPTPPPSLEVLISVADQRLVLLRDGGVIAKYPISTSRYGVGDSWGSYKTPVGKLRVCDKIGDDFASGAVIKHRSATGEVLAPNAPGRDPIVTRVIWLEGTQDQNANARGRGIYIHGTPEETNIGKPVSWGCIRMRSEDVIALYNQIPVGTEVDIVADKLPRLHKYKPPQPPEPADGEQPSLTGLLAKLLPHKDEKQASANSPAPAPAMGEKAPAGSEKTPSAAAEPEKPVAVAEKPSTEKTAAKPIKIASRAAQPHFASEPVFAESSESGGSKSGSSEAWRAMQGSILTAGLPPAAPKTQPVTAQVAQAQK